MKYDVYGTPAPGSYLPWSRHELRHEAEEELARRPGPGRIVERAPLYHAGWRVRLSGSLFRFATEAEARSFVATEPLCLADARECGPPRIYQSEAEYPPLPLAIAPPSDSPMGKHLAAEVQKGQQQAEYQRWLSS